MTIKFLGHATFLVTSDDGVRIVTGGHDHADHNYVQGAPCLGPAGARRMSQGDSGC